MDRERTEAERGVNPADPALVPTVTIGELCRPTDADTAFGRFEGFLPVVDAATPAPPRPFWLLRDGPWRQHLTPPQPRIGPLGLNFVRDLAVCGSGYVFSDGRFIQEGAHTSKVALQWLQRDDYPDNPRTHPPRNEVSVGSPGLIVCGAGYPIYGHWLLDFLPRIAVARQALDELFEAFVIPLPDDVPGWLFDVLAFFCGVKRNQLRLYDRNRDRLHFRSACLPSFAHDGEHVLHPFATAFYRSFVPELGRTPRRRICLSRRQFEAGTRSAWRVFESRDAFERLAVGHGYEIVCPEDLDLAAQIALFADATHLLGEFGSGMHNAIFSPAGTRVGCFPLNNAIQSHIADACGHEAVYVDRSRARTDARGVVYFDVDRTDLVAMFDLMDRIA